MLRKVLKKVSCLFILLALASTGVAEIGRSNNYGVAKAEFNGIEVTAIKDERIKVGDAFEIRVLVNLRRDAEVSVSLSASGFSGDPKQPFVSIEGPSQFDKAAGPIKKNAGESVELKWKLKATNAWTGGSTPINADVSFSETKPPYRGDAFSFTIANIYIEPVGSAPAPNLPASTPRQPGFEALASIISLLTATAAVGLRRAVR